MSNKFIYARKCEKCSCIIYPEGIQCPNCENPTNPFKSKYDDLEQRIDRLEKLQRFDALKFRYHCDEKPVKDERIAKKEAEELKARDYKRINMPVKDEKPEGKCTCTWCDFCAANDDEIKRGVVLNGIEDDSPIAKDECAPLGRPEESKSARCDDPNCKGFVEEPSEFISIPREVAEEWIKEDGRESYINIYEAIKSALKKG